MAIVLPQGKQQFFNSNGDPLAGGKLWTMQPGAGITTPKDTWQDAGQTSLNTNPIILNARGEATVFWAGGYNVRLETSAGGLIYTVENINIDPSAATLDAALRADLASTSDPAKGAALIGNKYGAAGSVGLNLHSYIEDDGSYNLMGFVAQADKAAIRNGTSTVDQSSALQACLTAAYVDSMKGVFVPAGKFPLIGGATLTMSGNRITQSMTIRGVGRFGSRFVKLSGSNSPLTIKSPNPAVTHVNAQLVIEDVGFFGATKGSDGLVLQGIAAFSLNRVLMDSFDIGLRLDSVLVGEVNLCEITSNNIGVRTRRLSTYCNAMSFSGGIIAYNSTRGLDIGDGSGFWIGGGIDIERNGTVADTSTGALIIRNTVDDEIGYGMFIIDNAWFEANNGYAIDVENTSNLFFCISGTEVLSSESGRALRVAGARSVSLKNSFFVGNTSTIDITSDKFTMDNSLADVITDNSTFPVYNNSASGSAEYVSGLPGSFTATLTGCTTSPTGTVNFIKQGKQVRLIFPDITGTSNTTAATLTGLPAKLWPLVQRTVLGICRDNGTEKASPISIGVGGVITLNNGFAGNFTAAGTKGISTLTVDYEI